MTMRRLEGIITMTIALGAGCASAPPQDLVDARVAYARVSQGPAARVLPAQVDQVRECLARAEQSFAEQPNAQRTRDLAYVAERRAQAVEAMASRASEGQGGRP
jgi:hypothetical protein